MEKHNNKTEKNINEKFLCFCSRVTRLDFKKKLNDNLNLNLDEVCKNLEIAKSCAACLPNIEDEFFRLKGKKNDIKLSVFKNQKFSFKKKITRFLDYLSGYMLVSQYGHIPMLASNDIETWLIISNHAPSHFNSVIVPYEVSLEFFDELGDKVAEIKKLVNKNKTLKICLNEYISANDMKLEPYYVKLKRAPLQKGFRGSTRPHFFYKTKKSMSTLHSQDGSSKNNFLEFLSTNNKDKNYIFIINPSNQNALIRNKSRIFKKKSYKNLEIKKIIVPAKGVKLLEVSRIHRNFENLFIHLESNMPIKCYIIIADHKFEKISVDHI